MNTPVSPRKRTAFPRVFWVANTVEILERFAYYGIYFGFGIYMESLGYSMGQLGVVQSLFLLLSYMTPVVSGTFADRYGFKRVLIVSYLAYLPSILLLIATKSFSGIALTMLSIGLAAGIFKPLVSGTVRAVTDQSNKTLGFGVFYWMVNVGASFGPIVAGHLRAISWSYAFYAAAAAIVLMLLITVLFYEEPSRQIEGTSLRQKLRDVGTALSDVKFAVFLVLLGIFFWVPFWAFFSLCALYVDNDLDTARLYEVLRAFLGAPIANFLSHIDAEGRRRVLGETISHTGWFIMLLQLLVSRTIERWRALPTLMLGLGVSAAGFLVLGWARVSAAPLVFFGIFLFALGEMLASPRTQEYITWIAPKEKAGLYMGTNFLATGIGAAGPLVYTPLYGHFRHLGHPEAVWYVLAVHALVAVVVFAVFVKVAGEFRERDV
jgi:POT family proton-dependent oligopeptide transporter